MFGRFSDGLDLLEELAGADDSTETLIEAAREALEAATEEFGERKAAEENQDHSAEWDYMSSASPKGAARESDTSAHDTRSVFADVDH